MVRGKLVRRPDVRLWNVYIPGWIGILRRVAE